MDRQDSGRDPARTAAGRTATLASDDDREAAAGRPVAGRTDGLDRCLLYALLICCPPAGIAWLLAARHRARASRHRVLAAVGPAAYGPAGNAVRARDGWRAEDR